MHNILKKSFTFWSVLLGLSSPFVYGETLSTTGSFVVHEKDITQYIKDQTSKWLTPNEVIVPSLSLNAPYKTTLTNISWQGNASLNWTKTSANNIWILDGQTTDLTLYANSMAIHDTMQVNVGGNTINVRIDADCQNLSLTLPGQWKVHGEIPMSWSGGALNAPLQNVKLTPSLQMPVIKIASCQGPTGMQDFLNQQVARLFANPASIQASLTSEVQKFINQQVAKVTAMMGKTVSFDILGAQVSFTPRLGQNLTSGTWILDGPLVLSAPQGTGNKTLPQGYTLANMTDVRASGFVFANSLWTQIMGFASRAGLFNVHKPSSEISAFQSFMNNRMEQFFVWSDLMNFSTTQPFNFTFQAPSTPRIQSQTNTFPGVQWNVAGPLYVQMDAVFSNGIVPYTQFTSNSPVTAQISAKAINGALNVNYSVTNLDMNYAFRREFLKIRQPMFGIGMGAIDQAVQSAETNQTWSFAMPDSASPLPGYRMLFSDLIFGKKTFRIEMGIQKK